MFSSEYQNSMYPYKIQNIFCKVYFKYFPMYTSMCTWTQVFPSHNQRLFFPDMLNTSPLWRSSCQRPAWSHGSSSCSWNITIFVGTWDPRNAMQGSAGFCFSKTNPREVVIVYGEKKRQKGNNLQYKWVYGDSVSKGYRSLKGFLFWCLVFDPISTPNKSFSIATNCFVFHVVIQVT